MPLPNNVYKPVSYYVFQSETSNLLKLKHLLIRKLKKLKKTTKEENFTAYLNNISSDVQGFLNILINLESFYNKPINEQVIAVQA